MKTLIRVTVEVEQDVEIEVTHAEGDDPCDLTDADRLAAFNAFDVNDFTACMTIRRARVVKP